MFRSALTHLIASEKLLEEVYNAEHHLGKSILMTVTAARRSIAFRFFLFFGKEGGHIRNCITVIADFIVILIGVAELLHTLCFKIIAASADSYLYAL